MWFAQSAPSSDPTEWIQFGVAGLVVAGLLLGWLWAKPAVDRILRDNDRLRDELTAERNRTEAFIGEIHGLRGEVHAMRQELARDRPAP